ncbi:hypothetical protein M116_2634 [Bacteroides fragilis str. 3719 A10]|nr:hypothetical protein M077_4928 [Bacteroides fragilis str. 2-F-2 \
MLSIVRIAIKQNSITITKNAMRKQICGSVISYNPFNDRFYFK